MFAVVVQLAIAEGHEGPFMDLLAANARASREKEAGCLQFDICTDSDRPGEVLLYELYESRAAFDAHLASPHFRDFDARTSNMIAKKQVQTWAEVIR